MKNEYLISAAGGNATAIEVLRSAQSRDWYSKHGDALLKKYEPSGAEQSGFLIAHPAHLEMAGGEFCGNATRAAAVILSKLSGKDKLSYTVSGFDATIEASVKKRSDTLYDVECLFPDMHLVVKYTEVKLQSGTPAYIVDLGGIVHVLIAGNLPTDYSAQHTAIRKFLKLDARPAVGVIWFRTSGLSVSIDPVVWVKSIDSFFYETSCGSGSIAAGIVTGGESVRQVSGGVITVRTKGANIILQSEMEVMMHEEPKGHQHPA